MRRPLRLQHDPAGNGGVVDVSVDVSPTATVGDLADALARSVGASTGGTVASRWPHDQRCCPPPRDAPVMTHGPRAGATVVLTAATGDPSPATAPVRLVGPRGRELQLSYGPNRIGTARIDVTGQVTVRAEGGGDVRLGGRPLIGACRVSSDDLVTIDSRPWTVRIDAPLGPPRGAGWTSEHRARPAAAAPGADSRLRLPTPPATTRVPRFPTLSASVPLLMGLALWWATGSLLAAAFMGMSVVFVVASGIESRREARADDRERVAEFRADMADAIDSLRERAGTQRAGHAASGLSPSELMSLSRGCAGPVERIWERSSSSTRPSLQVRLGTGRRALAEVPELPDTGRRDLRAELAAAVAEHSEVDDVVVVDLRATLGLVVESPDERGAAVARSVLLQLCTLIDPDQLEVHVHVSRERRAAWGFAEWLPHSGNVAGRTRVVVVDGAEPEGLDGHPDQVVVWVTSPGGARPGDVTAVLSMTDEDASLWLADDADGSAGPVLVEPIDADEATPLARRLCPLVPAATTRIGADLDDRSPNDRLARSVALADVAATPSMVVDPTAVLAHWGHAAHGRLAAPVGLDRHGAVVNLDLVSDGPHALVAGTTGAGKSELLRTFLVATALHHPPERVNFLLVDYKGGAAFGPLGALPHTVGTITDLSGAMADRALQSLRAELRRREEILADAQLERWTGASLLVVVDELATLVAERPTFVDGLVDLAQRGRSLGVHLVLATQRPAGVVTDAIRANVTMRICLRVADEDDSRDIVDVGAAAHLPRDVPGRALVRLGVERVSAVQIAHCGPVHPERPPVTVAVDGSISPRTATTGTEGMCPAAGGPNELDLAVATIVEAARTGGFAPAHRPWLDPLPEVLTAPDRNPSRAVAGSVPAQPSTRSATLSIGLVDRPDRQRQEPLSIDMDRDGGALIVGASGSGTTGAAKALAVAACEHPIDNWHVHVIYAGGGSSDLRNLPAVGDVIPVNDIERVRRLMRDALDEIDRRAELRSRDPGASSWGSIQMPRRMLVIDGMAAFEHHHARVDRGIAVDQLARIAREGRAGGVHLVLTAQRRAEIPMEFIGLIGTRIVLRCTSADEASLWGLDESASTPASMPPGRCRIDGSEAQITWYRDTTTCALAAAGRRAPAVPRCPTLVRAGDISGAGCGGWSLPLGLDADALAPVAIDLSHHHAIVAGPPRSGVSTTLELIAGSVEGAVLVRDDDPAVLGRAVDRAIDRAASGSSALLVVDEVSFALDGPDGDEFAAQLDRAATAARGLDIRLVIGGEVDSLLRCYHDVVGRIRRGRTGVMLGGDPDLHAALWHATVAPSADLPPAAGRGWLLGPGAASRVQIAHP